MSLDIGNAETAEEIAAEQLKFIGMQETNKTPSSSLKIRCACLALHPWKDMHRCLYCSAWFCKVCAEEHFGKTTEVYKSEADLKELLSAALRALCLTRDYVGEGTLPAIAGWEWYDAGKKISLAIPDDSWAEQFALRTPPTEDKK